MKQKTNNMKKLDKAVDKKAIRYIIGDNVYWDYIVWKDINRVIVWCRRIDNDNFLERVSYIDLDLIEELTKEVSVNYQKEKIRIEQEINKVD